MNTFIVELENRPGMLAGLMEAIAGRGINITAVTGATSVEQGAVALGTSDAEATREVLRSSGVTFREVESVSVSLEHRPGSLADAARRLANGGVNIEALWVESMGDGRATVAFAVDDASAARSSLGELAEG